MDRWSNYRVQREPEQWWVKEADAEAYAEEKRKEGVREGMRDGQAYIMEHEISVREAVKREQEEIISDLQAHMNVEEGQSRQAYVLKEAIHRIRSRGAGTGDRFYTCLKCRKPFKAPVHMLYCDDCVITEFNKTQPAPKLEKLEHVSESEFDGDKYWAVKKINAAFDAIESLRREHS